MSATKEVRVAVELDDLLAFNAVVASGESTVLGWVTSRWAGMSSLIRLLILLGLCAVILPGLVGLGLFLVVVAGQQSYFFLLGSISGLIIAVLGGCAVWRAIASRVVTRRALLEEQLERYRDGISVSITHEGVTVLGLHFFHFHHWLAIRQIIQTGNHLFLRTGKYEAIILPRTAFETDQAFSVCAHLCEDYFDGLDAALRQTTTVAPVAAPGSIQRPPFVISGPR